jgi:hypothetical protein
MDPLELIDLVPTLIVVWICALLIPAAELAVARYRGHMPTRPLLFALSQYICFGSLFTVFGIAQRANALELTTFDVYIFTIVMAALAVAGAGWATHSLAQRKT